MRAGTPQMSPERTLSPDGGVAAHAGAPDVHRRDTERPQPQHLPSVPRGELRAGGHPGDDFRGEPNHERWGILPPAARSATGRRQYGPRHLHAILAARAMQAGYGWQTGNRILRRVQQGDVAGALEMVDRCHAALHEGHRQVERTLETLRVIAAATQEDASATPQRRSARRGETVLRVGEAAQEVGVRVSSLHFWEAQGLLHPRRAQESGYRLYDRTQLARLRVVKVLREAGHGFEAIRATLDELGAGRPEAALTAIERRREELTRASERCARATAALWGYVAEVHGKPGALSGSLPPTGV